MDWPQLNSERRFWITLDDASLTLVSTNTIRTIGSSLSGPGILFDFCKSELNIRLNLPLRPDPCPTHSGRSSWDPFPSRSIVLVCLGSLAGSYLTCGYQTLFDSLVFGFSRVMYWSRERGVFLSSRKRKELSTVYCKIQVVYIIIVQSRDKRESGKWWKNQ